MTSRACVSSATSFGPGSSSGSFDFTLLFEQAIFGIAPACLFLLATPWRLHHTWKSSIKTRPSQKYILNLVGSNQSLDLISHVLTITCQSAIAVLVFLQLILLVLWSAHACERTATSTAAAVLALIVAMVLVPLSHTEHVRLIRPSTLICVYLVASMFFDAVQARTLFITGDNFAISVTLCCSIATKIIMLFLEASEKRAYLRTSYNSYPPESIASTFNRTFLWWLNRIFFTGFRKIMTLDDLRSTTSELRSKVPAKRLRKSWSSRCAGHSEVSPPSRWMLPLASLSCFRSKIISVIPARLFLIGFNYAQPFLFARAACWAGRPKNRKLRPRTYRCHCDYISWHCCKSSTRNGLT